MKTVEAERVVLAPVDTEQIHTFGWRVNPSVIDPKVVRDEKKELLGIPLRAGQEISVVYSFGGRPAAVRYLVEEIQPPNSFVGSNTIVEILGEEPDETPLLSPDRVRATLRMNLELLQEEVASATKESLPAEALVAQAAAIRESLQRIF